jgi:hypothetical protein
MMQGQGSGRRLGQRGFLSQRTWGIVLVLGLLMLVPYWMATKTGNKTAALTVAGPGKPALPAASRVPGTTTGTTGATAATAGAAAMVAAALPAAAPVASPDRFGLSFGHGERPSKFKDLMVSACAGAPLDMGNPDNGQCNPAQGDSSCRTALPILCVLQDGSTAESAGLVNEPKSEAKPETKPDAKDAKPEPKPPAAPKGLDLFAGWVGGSLAATAPVAGFVIGSLAQAHARCASELGTGWRMAEYRDAGTGEGLVGRRGQGLVSTNTRHWVAAKDQKSHCWDPS